jgi:peptidoglycan/xylan/chitin deacetylase (PgdA/CDA1 family)
MAIKTDRTKDPAAASLRVVLYHYVRDRGRTTFPRLNAISSDRFRDQVDHLSARYEMATLEAALAFLRGEYQPDHDLCLLTFDDGLKEHYREVLPVLVEKRIQGLFFVITGCVEGGVAAVHKNHFLMAALDFDTYRAEVLRRLATLAPGVTEDTDPQIVRNTYRWDTPEVGQIKYLVNFKLGDAVRRRVLDDMFAANLGDEVAFARGLYLSWDEAREMQGLGMLIGGHSHTHVPLAVQRAPRQREELMKCAEALHSHLREQNLWPFAYPHGKPDTFSEETNAALQGFHFDSAFVTVVGDNLPGQDLYEIHRVDPKDAV